MIEVKIITKDVNSAQKVLKSLKDGELAINGFITKETVEILNPKFILIAQSRASLFNDVLIDVKNCIGEGLIAIYSTPIVNIEWQRVDKLLKKNISA